MRLGFVFLLFFRFFLVFGRGIANCSLELGLVLEVVGGGLRFGWLLLAVVVEVVACDPTEGVLTCSPLRRLMGVKLVFVAVNAHSVRYEISMRSVRELREI